MPRLPEQAQPVIAELARADGRVPNLSAPPPNFGSEDVSVNTSTTTSAPLSASASPWPVSASTPEAGHTASAYGRPRAVSRRAWIDQTAAADHASFIALPVAIISWPRPPTG